LPKLPIASRKEKFSSNSLLSKTKGKGEERITSKGITPVCLEIREVLEFKAI
jgi:hypothetical protein